jgi:anti-sigma B factor antagonist
VRERYYSIDTFVPKNGLGTLRLGGSLDIGAREDVRDSIMEAAAAPGLRTLMVDLSGVAFLDSEALAGLIEGFLRVRETGVGIRMVNAYGIVRRVLEVTGTLELFGTD